MTNLDSILMTVSWLNNHNWKFIDEIRNSINVWLDDEIKVRGLYFTTLIVEQHLVMKGFPANYLEGCEDIPEDTKIRLIDNAPNIDIFSSILSQIVKAENSEDE